jgi:NADH-quinone oxidoreductase subunit M
MNAVIFSLLLVPLFGSFFIFIIPKNRVELFRPVSILFTLISLTQAVYLLFDSKLTGNFKTYASFEWISLYGLDLNFGLSGMSILLLVLSALLVTVSILSVSDIHSQSKGFIGSILTLHFAINGVFISGDLVSLFIFFEAILIPMYFLMGIWGGENRRYATIKFIIYTVFGSIFIFIGTIYTGLISYSVNGRLALDYNTLSQ